MLSEVHAAHPAGAKVSQDFMIAQEEASVLTLQNLFGLPPRNQPGFFKFLADGYRILGHNAAVPLFNQFKLRIKHSRLNKPAFLDEFEYSVRCDLRHAKLFLEGSTLVATLGGVSDSTNLKNEQSALLQLK